MLDPKVSIIIPVFNGSNYLGAAIESALAQSYRPIEVIVVNDGSNDNGETERVALDYGSDIRYLKKENGGVSSALNLGIEVMAGEYFSWLSHDDIYLPDKIAKQVEFLNRADGVKVVACDLQVIDSDGKVVGDSVNDKYPVIANGRVAFSTWIYACSLLIHKSCFLEVGKFNVSNKTTQDAEMILKLAHRYSIHCIPEILCQWRRHAESGSETAKERQKIDKLKLVEFILNDLEVTWFFPPGLTVNPESWFYTFHQTTAYNWLGNQVLVALRSPDGAELCYRHAVAKKSLISLAPALKLYLGMQALQCLYDRYHRYLLTPASTLYRKVKPLKRWKTASA